MPLVNMIVNRLNIKRIAITCRCGTRFVDEIPGELLEGGADPVLSCPNCQQMYALEKGKLRRIEREEMVKILENTRRQQEAERELVDNGGVGQKKDAWQMPGSKLVN